ncbi:hypothetical protein GCM10009776_34460 [Microbacterium deminutum]|uniref:MBL fold metallo-hydrolase n=1 Tax=Microbacterium deminutum TaxID=344164 RepID=A0ABN2RH77_9MICO
MRLGDGNAERRLRITVLNDAFGADAAMVKDWGYSTLIEAADRRILFDTGTMVRFWARTRRPNASICRTSTSR